MVRLIDEEFGILAHVQIKQDSEKATVILDVVLDTKGIKVFSVGHQLTCVKAWH